MLIRSLIAIAAVFGAVVTGCVQKSPKAGAAADSDVQPIEQYIKGKGYEKYSTATFAGGCFWCIEASFERIRGVKDVISGYSGGDEKYPTYEQVGSSATLMPRLGTNSSFCAALHSECKNLSSS